MNKTGKDLSGCRILIVYGKCAGQEGVCLGKSTDGIKWAVSPNDSDEVLDWVSETEFGLLLDLSGDIRKNRSQIIAIPTRFESGECTRRRSGLECIPKSEPLASRIPSNNDSPYGPAACCAGTCFANMRGWTWGLSNVLDSNARSSRQRRRQPVS
jgi:hypothetical protein